MQEVKLTTISGEKISITPFDVKAVRDLGKKGVEIDLHSGDTHQLPLSRYLLERMLTIDLRGTGNSATQIPNIKM
jgi:hypothetical protein